MRKTLLLALLLVFTCVQVQADPVSLQKARSQAAAFLLQQGLTLAETDAQSVHRGVRRSGKFAMQPAYYVFNAADDAGFVVVSGDDRTAPILAHTQRGAYDAARLPQNLKSWFEACEEYIT
ncbi:MAG: Spi family protease inhibitor, partial [Bacteroidaceae bacterium]|nr:Spi family protease inhibitor [Bacteroidaceae bacterium]